MRFLVQKFISIVSLVSCFYSCNTVETGYFEISGNLEADLDTIGIYPSFIPQKFLEMTFNDYAAVDDGAFLFKGHIPHPYMFNLHSSKVGVSEPFFVDNGNIEIKTSFVNSDRTIHFINPEDKSQSQLEYEKLKSSKLDSITFLIQNAELSSEIEKYRSLLENTLLAYAKEKPDSFVALWLLVERHCWNNSEYKPVYEASLEYFSDNVKNSKLYRVFKESLMTAKSFSFKNKSIDLKDFDGNAVTFNNDILKQHKYTLIDFWFSNCAPCLATMPEYKPIYNDFKDKGFEIISISIDGTKKIDNWKRVILEQEFDWAHYLDENGVETQKMNITSFPTTFLVDSSGEILLQNASIEDLIKVLEENLLFDNENTN
jgi:thiol-disulfide isomerase/thioredoxin